MATLENEFPERFRHGNKNNNIVGAILASAATIAPTHGVHVVSGTVAIVTITLPWDGFAGDITFLPTGIFTWTTAGNIALAGTAVVGKALKFTYNPVTAKWYPSYVA